MVFLIKTLSAEENLQFFLHWLKTRKLNKMEVKCENSQQRRPEIDCFDEIVVLLSQSLQNWVSCIAMTLSFKSFSLMNKTTKAKHVCFKINRKFSEYTSVKGRSRRFLTNWNASCYVVDGVMELAQLNMGKFEIEKLTLWSRVRCAYISDPRNSFSSSTSAVLQILSSLALFR